MDRVSIKAYVIDYIKSMHYLFLQVCTAGSKNHDPERTGAAFYVPECEVRKSGRITDDTSVYTTEMIAILMSLQLHQINRSDILIEIFTLYRLKKIGIITNLIWVPARENPG